MSLAVDRNSSARPARSGRAGLSAYQRAIALLARREHSQRELRQKLLQREHSWEEVDAALQRLSEQGLQSEDRYAESMARTRHSAGHGPLRIRNDLRQQGLSEDRIDAAVSELDPDWQMQALDVLRRKFGQPDTEEMCDQLAAAKLRNRQLSFLLRRGFDAETAHVALRCWREG